MAHRRLAIIGGDAAGMSAAAQARRRDADLDIVAFERGPYTSYSACGIGKRQSPINLPRRAPSATDR